MQVNFAPFTFFYIVNSFLWNCRFNKLFGSVFKTKFWRYYKLLKKSWLCFWTSPESTTTRLVILVLIYTEIDHLNAYICCMSQTACLRLEHKYEFWMIKQLFEILGGILKYGQIIALFLYCFFHWILNRICSTANRWNLLNLF